MTIQFKTQHLAAKLDVGKQMDKEQEQIEHNALLDPIIDQVDTMLTNEELPLIKQHLTRIENLISYQDIPIATLKSACRITMLELAKNPDTLLELEPEEISLIVRGYTIVADQEKVAILEGKTKTSRKGKTTKSSGLTFKLKETEAISLEIQEGKVESPPEIDLNTLKL